ncbi:uncharacterized protein LOC125620725 [Caretta caretta]|uniref:uncharacterized protein LOC125620725 n=1 Tax=Caretta caretta TaxID=8467 RepID=UPI003F4B428E
MQSSSAQVTMMESQNRKRAPAWTEREVRDLIAVWGEESVLSELRSSFRNAKTFVKISQGMKDRGHNRDPKQCRVKLKELRQAYQKTREANSRSGSEPQTCRFYDELHAILGGSATTTPAVLFDSFNGDGGNTEAGFGDEEDDDEEEVVDSSQQASGETGFPDSQELFLTLDLESVPPEPTQGCLLDPAGGEGTSAACVSMITGSSPSQRLVKLRKKKKRTRNEMFSELMLSSHTDRAQTNARRQIMSECRKAQNDREERWRAEERAEAQMWRQRDERRQDSMLRLLQDQTSMLQCMVELQQRQLEHRLPLLPLCNQPPSSPSSIASTPRRPRTCVQNYLRINVCHLGKKVFSAQDFSRPTKAKRGKKYKTNRLQPQSDPPGIASGIHFEELKHFSKTSTHPFKFESDSSPLKLSASRECPTPQQLLDPALRTSLQYHAVRFLWYFGVRGEEKAERKKFSSLAESDDSQNLSVRG